MKKNNLTEIVFILDASGSMYSLTADTIGGFNSMLAQQKEEPGEAYVSTVIFSDNSRVIHDRVKIGSVPELTAADYRASGCTALLDAVGGAIHHIGNIHKYARPEDVPARTLFIITTDGMENASRCYDLAKVRKMIERQKKRHGWEFIFLGANIDAAETARTMGISEERSVNWSANAEGSAMLFRSVGKAVCNARSCAPMDNAWREELDEANKR